MHALAVFRNRREAGERLALQLSPYRDRQPVVLALPRGGVVVGYEVALALGAPLDVVVARKLGAPGQPELGIGAIAPAGIVLVDVNAVRSLGLSEDEIATIVQREREEMERRLIRYRGDDTLPDVAGRTAIIVDDGLATGVTARAAIACVRMLNPRRIVLAVPVCAPATARAMQREVDELVCLATPEPFRAVGLWYEEFGQTTDTEVIELLEEARGSVALGSINEPD